MAANYLLIIIYDWAPFPASQNVADGIKIQEKKLHKMIEAGMKMQMQKKREDCSKCSHEACVCAYMCVITLMSSNCEL